MEFEVREEEYSITNTVIGKYILSLITYKRYLCSVKSSIQMLYYNYKEVK